MLSLITALMLASPNVVHDFSAADRENFSTINDTVMGGKSDAALSVTDEGSMVFSGNVSLENNGGFTSFRSRDVEYDLAGTDGLQLKVRGDGRKYIFSCAMRGVPVFAGGYWQEFQTEQGEWTTVRLPYAGFVPHSFGRKVPQLPALAPARLTEMGVYLYDKQAGPFRLECGEIRGYTGSEPASDDSKGWLPANCSTLASLLEKTGLDQEVLKLNGFTLFAPTDAAFAALPADVVESLLREENRAALKKVLLHHVIASPVTAYKASRLDRAEMLDGVAIALTNGSGSLRVDNATVVDPDLLIGGGVVHVIDAVLVPEDLELAPQPSGIAAVLSAAIERGVPLFNDGNEAACAAVYATAINSILALQSGALDDSQKQALSSALTQAGKQSDRAAAWTLRRAIDQTLRAS